MVSHRVLRVTLMCVALATAQMSATFASDQNGSTLSGTVIVADPVRAPVRGVLVVLTSPSLKFSRSAISGEDGRFAFFNLPPGHYDVVAERPGFITSAFGAKGPARMGTAVTLDGTKAVEDLVIRLWRGAVIAGVIEDESGEPVRSVQVRAIQKRRATPSGFASLTNNGVKTDDLGKFRIYGLEPGSYILVASPPVWEGANISSPTAAHIDAILESLRRRTPLSVREPTLTPEDASAFVPTFYPAQISPDETTPVTLAAGQELVGIRMQLTRVRTAAIAGHVYLPDGTQAGGADVQLIPLTVSESYEGLPVRKRNVTSAANGEFRISQVLPGRYVVMAKVQPTNTTGLAVAGAVTPGLSAIATLSVSTANIDNVELRVSEGRTINGRVAFAKADGTVLQPKEVSQCRLVATSDVNTQAVSVRPDGSFVLPQLLPVPYRLRTAGSCTSPAWWPLSAKSGTVDVFDGPAELEDGVEISFTDQPSVLTGKLHDAKGFGVSDVFVVAYAADPRYWKALTRRVQAVRPSQDGSFSIRGLPDGDYLLAVVTDADPDEWYDGQFLGGLTAFSVKTTVSRGKTTQQNLEVRR